MTTLAPTRKRLFLIGGFLLAFLAVFNFSTFVLYERAKAHLENELGERLRSISITLSHAVEMSSPDSLPGEFMSPSVLTLLHMARDENLLTNIVVVTPDGHTVVDLSDYSQPGELNPFLDLDFSAVTLARSGIPAYTSLYQSGEVFMKSAYAPITAVDNRVVGILGVEAGASYFQVLRALSKAILLVDAGSLVVIVFLGAFFYRQSLSLGRAEAAVIRGENLATMGRMVAGIAHEIRNPLSIIKTSAERLGQKYEIKDEAVSYITEEVDKLDRILTGYLDFAKADTQPFAAYSVAKIIKRCLMILEPEFKKSGTDLVTALPPGDVRVFGDDKKLQQALLNILINALQAVPAEGRIEVSLETRGRFAAVTIKDNGGGIDEKNLKEVSRPFYTTKKHGSGLGLSIVDGIVSDHKGKFEIKSAPGAGTEVSLSIPTAAPRKNG